MLIANSDLSSSILPRSPLIPNPVETLNEASPSAPIVSIGADDAHPLDLSSPKRNRDGDQVCLSREAVMASPTTTPLDETLTLPSLVSLDHGECSDAQVMQEPLINFCDSDSPSWTPNVSPGYDTDDDESAKAFWNQPLSRLVQEPLIEPPCVGAGLWNLGNSCFVNSVLQCFTHTVPLIDSLCSYSPDPCNCQTRNCGNESTFCVLRTLRGHIESALMTSRCSISPYYFFSNLNYFSPDFRPLQQQDAHEFLQAFLDKLEICCLNRSSARDNVTSQDVNIVQQIFGGRLVSGLRCCSCNSVSETFENSLGLSLEIGDVDNLQSALDSFTRVEKLDEQMTCDNCEGKVSKEKQLLLDKLPLVVTFHLKRFKNIGFFLHKIFKHVEFPLELDLQPYMRNSQSNVATKYHLYALVEHLGSLAYGHYSSYVRSAPKIWHEFDDQKVTKVSEDFVLAQDSYILFYAKEGTPWFRSIYEEFHPSTEASLENSSPNSVPEPTNGECSSEISSENVCKSNKPCGSAGVSDLGLVKTEENCVSLSNESKEDVYQSAESSDMTESMEPYDLDDDDLSSPCTETEADSCLDIKRATTGDDRVTSYLMVQNQVSSPKQQERTFQIELEQLETKKNQEEESCKQPLSVSDVAESEIVHGNLMKKPSPQVRELDQDIPESGSPPKKLKT